MKHYVLRAHCTTVLKWLVVIAVAVVCVTTAFDFWCKYNSTYIPLEVPWRAPRPLQSHYSTKSSSTSALTAESIWEQQALANLSEYRNHGLENLKPYYGKKEFWGVMLPIITCPPSRPIKRYGGTSDGSKLLCDVTEKLQREGCVIYSLGSNGDYSFERSMLKETRCQIHTFDCTYANGTSQDPSRHHYHHWCLGGRQIGDQYRSWDNITASLQHTSVDLLKMDIEGYEYDVLSSWRPGSVLPDDLSVEFHVEIASYDRWPRTTAELGLNFMFLANLGYAA